MSGLYAPSSGAGSVVSAEMAGEDFGAEGLGRKIRVVFCDHKHNVDVASAITNRWFDDEQVGAVVDMPNSAVALAVQKLAAARKRISVTVTGGSSDLTGKDCTNTGFHWALRHLFQHGRHCTRYGRLRSRYLVFHHRRLCV